MRLVCEQRNESTQRNLLRDADLPLAKAMDIVQGKESAERNAKSFKNLEVVVQKLVSPLKELIRSPCYWCGRPNHDAKECRF